MKAGQKGKGSACCPWASTAAWGSTALCHRSSPKAWAIPRAAERKESWMKRVSEIGAHVKTPLSWPSFLPVGIAQLV